MTRLQRSLAYDAVVCSSLLVVVLVASGGVRFWAGLLLVASLLAVPYDAVMARREDRS